MIQRVVMRMIEPKLRFKADDGSNFPEWEEHKIKEFVIESNILGHTGKEAKKLTVKLWGKGVVPKENIFSGSENTQYYIRHSGQLMYGKLDFLNCAFGIVPPELDGYESTLDAPAFDIHDISDKFLLSYITRKSFYKKNGDIANGSRKAKRIHPNVFGEMSIMVPSLSEQQKIAEFLSTIDTVIEKQKETVSAWEERKKGVMQKLFSQEVRFKADDGSDFPDWEEKKLGDICKTFSGGTPKSGEARYYENGTISFIRSGEIHDDKTEMRITNNGLNESSAKMVDIGDILYALYGATSGEVDISKIKGAINQAILCIRPLNDFNRKFIVEILRCNKENILRTYLQGGQGNLSAQIIQRLFFDFPCREEQQKIADCLSSLDEVIEKQKATLAAWGELKKGLLQQMFV